RRPPPAGGPVARRPERRAARGRPLAARRPGPARGAAGVRARRLARGAAGQRKMIYAAPMLSPLALLVALQGAPAPPVEEPPKRYGDQGTSHFGLMLGIGGGGGGFAWAGGFNYGYFVLDGVAPGADL